MAARAALRSLLDERFVGRVIGDVGGRGQHDLGNLPRGGVFPSDWLSTHINQKAMYALYHLLRQFCERHQDVLRRMQDLIDVDGQSMVGAYNRGRAKNRETHALLMQLFALQVEHGFMLSLNWISTAENGVADAISRPSRCLLYTSPSPRDRQKSRMPSSA